MIVLSEARKAKEDLARVLRVTPVLAGVNIGNKSQIVDLKLEYLQIGGSFKIRGAMIKGLRLLEQGTKGFAAISAGNHAIAVAYAGKLLRVPVTVVIPSNATNPERVSVCKRLGANVVLTPDRASAFTAVKSIVENESLDLIHPFDSWETILGTATIGLEIWEQFEENIDSVWVPVGGGGLIAGIAWSLKALCPHVRILAVEPNSANNMQMSIKNGAPLEMPAIESIADSLTPPMVGAIPFQVCRDHVDEFLSVSESDIINAGKSLYSAARILIEPAGVCGLAGFLASQKERTRGAQIVLLSGSNIPIDQLGKIYV